MKILKLLAKENYITYSKPIAKIVGVNASILYGELCSLCNLYDNTEFFCEYNRLCEDTCLTEYSVREALKILYKHKLVSVVKKGLPAKNYYSLNEEMLEKILEHRSTRGNEFDTTGDNEFDTTGDNESVESNNINNINNINNKKSISKNKEKEISKEKEFDEFWKLYPRKVGKDIAKKSFLKSTEKPEIIIEALRKQITAYDWKHKDKQYIPHPSTWLNQKRWEDEIYESGEKTNAAKQTLPKNENDLVEYPPRSGNMMVQSMAKKYKEREKVIDGEGEWGTFAGMNMPVEQITVYKDALVDCGKEYLFNKLIGGI